MKALALARLTPPGGPRVTRNVEKWASIGILLLPALVIYTWMVILPVIRAAQFSLYSWNGLGPLTEFIGLGNFVAIMRDEVFRVALGNNLFIIVLSLLVQLPLALGLAVLLQSRLPGRAVFRTVYFMPYVISEVIAAFIFRYIFRPEGGLINMVLGTLHITGPAWLADTHIVMYAVFVTLTWKYFGYHMVLYLAGLQGIPAELKEAAKIDGASSWETFRYVTLPLLTPTIRLTIYLSVIGSLQVFDLVWAMTRGGPVSASETMATYMYRAGFIKQQLGYGSALAIIIFLICFGFSLVYQHFAMRRDVEGAY